MASLHESEYTLHLIHVILVMDTAIRFSHVFSLRYSLLEKQLCMRTSIPPWQTITY